MLDLKKSVNTSKELKMRARELWKQATPAEKIVWEKLRNRRLKGIKFRRQHILGPYIVDFYSPAYRLVIEIEQDIDTVLDNIIESCGLPSPSIGRSACPARSVGIEDEGAP